MDTAEVAGAARREDSAARIIGTRMAEAEEEVAAEDLEDQIAEADIDKEEAVVMAVEDGLDTEEEVVGAGADLQEPGAGEREEIMEDPPMIGGDRHLGNSLLLSTIIYFTRSFLPFIGPLSYNLTSSLGGQVPTFL